MNVAVFTDNDFGKINGITTSLRALVRYAPAGLQPRIYTAADLREDRPEYFATPAFSTRMPLYGGDMRMYLPWFGTFLRQARQDRIDLVHLTTPGPVGLAAMGVAWRLGLPMIGSFHVDLAACTERLSGSPRLGRLMRQFLRWAYGRCERIFVPSDSTRRMLIGQAVNPAKIALWRRGVDTALFAPSQRSMPLRARWRVCDRRPAIIYAGRLSREKGLAHLPRIVSALHRRGVEHRLVLAGDGPMRGELAAGLPDAVFTGTLGPREVAAAMASSDLFVFPSEIDSAGNVVLEAQACGLPVLVTDAGGPGEYVQPGVTGVICPAGDADAFGHAAAQLLTNAERRARLSAAARLHAETLSWEAALAPLYRAYAEFAPLEVHTNVYGDSSHTPAAGARA